MNKEELLTLSKERENWQKSNLFQRIVFDIETNGLDPDVIHCLVIKCIDCQRVKTYTQEDMQIGLEYLAGARQIIGHNIIAYDIPSLQKVYPSFTVEPSTVVDTLVLSRLIHADLTNEDYEQHFDSGSFLPKSLMGSHSLGAWGIRLNLHKGDYDGGWDTFSQEMLDYCVQDVLVNEALFAKLGGLEKYNFYHASRSFAHKLAFVCHKIGKFGWYFNKPAAYKLYGELAAVRSDLEVELHDLFPSWTISEEFIPKANNSKLGYVKGEPFTKVKEVQFNPNSRRHIEFCLRKKYDWTPKLLTAGGHAQIDESVLAELSYPEAQKLADYFTIQKRIGQLAEGKQAWMNLATADSKLHHNIIPQGTVTHRAAHRSPNLAQVPATRLPWGKECRQLFTVRDGYKLLGADLSGLELRCLAHYLDDQDYTKELLEGDIHTANMKAAGLKTRDQAKRFIYAFLYGAGAAKIGEVADGGAKEGKQLLDRFNENMPGIKRLRKAVEEAAERGYLFGLDGRQIKIRAKHKALNTLLQGAGATICGTWLIKIQEELNNQQLDANICAWVHDEVQIECREKDIEHVGNIVRGSAQAAGEEWRCRIPIAAEYTTGNSWADTH